MHFLVLFTLLSSLVFAERQTWFELESESKRRSLKFSAFLKDSILYYDLPQGHQYHHLYFGDFEARGRLIPAIDYRVQARVFTEHTDAPIYVHPYEPYLGLAYNQQSETQRTFDYLMSRVDYTGQDYEIHLALDSLRTGPSYRNPLVFSGLHSPWRPLDLQDSSIHLNLPVFYFGFSFPLSFLNYEHDNGMLRHQKELGKYFHTHLIAANWKGLKVGIRETVIYGSTTHEQELDSTFTFIGDRNWEPLYLLPFAPFFILEHYIGDQDNVTIALELSYQRQEWRFWNEWLIDDLKAPGQLFSNDWWGNKYAFTLGASFTTETEKPEDLQNRFLVEFARIEPWVYTHNKGGGFQFSHFGQPLGSNLGPNSMELFAEYKLSNHAFALEMPFTWVRKGLDFGSNLTDIHMFGDPEDKEWLADGQFEEWMFLGIAGQWQVTNWLNIELGIEKDLLNSEGLLLRTGVTAGY